MPFRKTFVLTVCACLAALQVAAGHKQGVPSFTNDDLDRLSPFRGQTGVLSTPAFAPGEEPEPRPSKGGHDEAYWRREAEHVHEKVRSLRQKANEIRIRLANAPSRSEGRKGRAGAASSDPTPALRARLAALEAEIRERRDRFEERARREGALPGWLR
jgi:hypothetical protein